MRARSSPRHYRRGRIVRWGSGPGAGLGRPAGLGWVQEKLEIVLRIRIVGTDFEGFPKVTNRGGDIPRRSERNAQVVVRVSVVRVDGQSPLELADRLRKLALNPRATPRLLCVSAESGSRARARRNSGIASSSRPSAFSAFARLKWTRSSFGLSRTGLPEVDDRFARAPPHCRACPRLLCASACSGLRRSACRRWPIASSILPIWM